ncbi:prolyl oligopeptidase family serine peptidase [Daejeonella sp.]|uniref:S9 family peptidase n=1 Tax=Daejeonella sp. TaxID=2805397 RepID=UPI003982D773
MKRFFIMCMVLLMIGTAYSQSRTYWSPEQTIRMKNITAVRVSPDGKKVVYAVREAVMTEDRSEYINQLYLSDASTDNSVHLTRGDKNNSNPRWSPDGKWIAFLSNRDGKNNIYLLPVGGGESERLTDVKTSVADFKWSPDGKAIAYTMSDAPSDVEEKNKKSKSDWYFMNEEHKQGRLYLISISEKDSSGKQNVLKLTNDNRHISGIDWSPDGKSIAYTHALSPGVNDNMNSDIALVTIASGEVKNVANTTGGESSPSFSPDGKYIAYLATNEEGIWGGKSYIKVTSVAGGQVVTLANTPNEPGELLGWSNNGQFVYTSEPYHTSTKIFRLAANGNEITEWKTGLKNMITLVALNDKGSHFGFVMQNSSLASDGYVSSTANFLPLKISTINPEIASYPVPKTEIVKWKSFDGKEIDGLLTYPLNYEAGRKYPLILNIHGGPAGVFAETFIAGNGGAYPIAALAEKGIFVLRPNPRGSTGYGVEFRLSNQRDWGGADYKDLMAGVDYTISSGLADSTKLAVMGWSYGGFMSSWTIGHTNRFKAASIGAPVVDLAAQNMTDDIAGFLPSYMKKQPWEDWNVYDTHSPLRFVQNVTTPVLLQHGDADIRVPFSQGLMFYNALKRKGVPVRFLVLPRQPHGPTEPKMVLKVNQTNLDWMEHYLLGKEKAF